MQEIVYKQQDMKEYVMDIGEIMTFDIPVTLTCHELGSCIGLFIQDRVKGISGGATILISNDKTAKRESSDWNTVKDTLQMLLHEFRNKGSDLTGLRAKITGGAGMTVLDDKSVNSIKEYMAQYQIQISASDVGGKQVRTVRFVSETGLLLIRTAGSRYYKIY